MAREVKESALTEVISAAINNTESREEAFDTVCLALAGLSNKEAYAHQEIADQVRQTLDYYALRQS